MSSVGSVSVAGSSLLQSSSIGRGSQSNAKGQLESKFQQAVKDAGGANVDFSSLENQIQSAVKDVLKNVDSSSDPQQVGSDVQQAIDTTLQQNGIDPAKVKSEMQPPGGRGRPLEGGPPPMDTSENSRTTSGTTESSLGSSFSHLLQSLRDSSEVSSQSQSSTNSSGEATNLTSSTDDLLQQLVKQLLQNLPVGSGVDATV